MASCQIRKGSDQATFFSEFLLFRQKYYNGENKDSFWEEIVAEGKKITDKYSNTEFGDFARTIVLDHIADVEIRFKGVEQCQAN